jgi:hypothetical protein
MSIRITSFVIIVLLCFVIHPLFSQKIKYKDVKRDYTSKNYSQIIEKPRRSVLLAAGLNMCYPGVGHVYIGEPLRGACFFGAEVVSFSLMMYGVVLMTESSNSLMFNTGIISFYFFWLWSIIDVIEVTKIKNLAYQDKRMSMSIYPSLFHNSLNNSNSLVYGLGLSVRF